MKTPVLAGGLLAVLVLLAGPAVAALSMSQIAGQCADASGFSSCWSTMQTMTEQCYEKFCEGEGGCDADSDSCPSSDPNCATNCACVAYEQMIQCALVHCWNMVRSCQYQNLAINAAMNCPTALGTDSPFAGSTNWIYIPYFPSSSTLPGACSCDIGFVYLIQRGSSNMAITCDSSATSSADDTLCGCCRDAVQVSAFYDICPDTDPAAVMADMPQFNLAEYVANAAACNNALAADTNTTAVCVAEGFDNPSVWGGTYSDLYTPANLPSNGTDLLSNGADAITTPAYDTIVWYLGNGLSTQTAIAVTTGSPSTTPVGPTVTTTGGTTTAPTQTGTSGAARQRDSGLIAPAVVAGVVVVVLL